MADENGPPDEVSEGGEDTPPIADNTSPPVPSAEPNRDDRSDQTVPRQSSGDSDKPVQLPLPGMDPNASNGWTSFEFAAAIERCARQGLPFTSADVRKLVPGEPENPNLIGLQFAHAARHGVIVPLAAVQSSVPSRRRGLVRLWQGRAAA